MPIKLLPYTDGISTTQLRKENFSHILPNDEVYLEKNNWIFIYIDFVNNFRFDLKYNIPCHLHLHL